MELQGKKRDYFVCAYKQGRNLCMREKRAVGMPYVSTLNMHLTTYMYVGFFSPQI